MFVSGLRIRHTYPCAPSTVSAVTSTVSAVSFDAERLVGAGRPSSPVTVTVSDSPLAAPVVATTWYSPAAWFAGTISAVSGRVPSASAVTSARAPRAQQLTAALDNR